MFSLVGLRGIPIIFLVILSLPTKPIVRSQALEIIGEAVAKAYSLLFAQAPTLSASMLSTTA